MTANISNKSYWDSLPESCSVNGVEYKIRNRGDYRVILDIISVLNDVELTEQQKTYAALYIFYEKADIPSDGEEAIKEMFKFINRGVIDENQSPIIKLMDWVQDFPVLVAPINRVLGNEIRSVEYLHWWTFIAAYMEIGECMFSFITGIREKQRKGIKLDRHEQEFYLKNREIVDLNSNLTKEEEDWINEILGGAVNGV